MNPINKDDSLYPQTSDLSPQSSGDSKDKERLPGGILDVESIAASVKTAKPTPVKNPSPPKSSHLDFSKILQSVTNRFALEGEKFRKYSGSNSLKKVNEELCQIVEKFIATDEPTLKEIDRARVLNSILRSYKYGFENTKSKLDSGEIISILSGWGIKGILPIITVGKHSTGIVLFKKQEGYFLIKCDRAMSAREEGFGLSIFKVNKPENIDLAMKKLSNKQKYESLSEGMTFFSKEINTLLGLEPYPDSQTNGLNHKDMSIGNCPTTAGRMLMEGVAYADLSQTGKTHTEALTKAYRLYKAFTTFDRAEGIALLKEWLLSPESQNHSQTTRDVLVGILHKATSKRNTELIQNLKEFVTPGIARDAITTTKSRLVMFNLLDMFKEYVTPERFLLVLKSEDYFNPNKKIAVRIQTMTHFFQIISNNPALKNDPSVLKFVLNWAEHKLLDNPSALAKADVKDLKGLIVELQKFSDIPEFKIPFQEFAARVIQYIPEEPSKPERR